MTDGSIKRAAAAHGMRAFSLRTLEEKMRRVWAEADYYAAEYNDSQIRSIADRLQREIASIAAKRRRVMRGPPDEKRAAPR